eukprot:COSAG04_NODE_11487_length_706_cov_1.166392_2_plen_54_part_01
MFTMIRLDLLCKRRNPCHPEGRGEQCASRLQKAPVGAHSNLLAAAPGGLKRGPT